MSHESISSHTPDKSLNPLISVIVASYNNAKYLPACIDSILSQTYPTIEIVIADDSSTDETAAIIDSYAGRYQNILPVYHRDNVGVARNRHDGICAAEGYLITTLDADDFYYDKRKLEAEISLFIHKNKSRDEDVITFSNVCYVDAEGEFIREMITPQSLQEGDILFGTITRTRPIPRDFVFTKDQYLEVGGYDQRLKLYEDWDLKIKLASQNRFYYTGIRGTAYRLHDSGLVQSSPRSFHIKHLWLVFNRHIEKLNSRHWPAAYIRMILRISRSFMQQLLFRYPQAMRLAKHLRYFLLRFSK